MNPTPFTIRILCLESVPPHNSIKQYRLLSVITTCQLLSSGSYQITLSLAVHHNWYGLATETSVCPSSLMEAFEMVMVIRFVNSLFSSPTPTCTCSRNNTNHSEIGDLQWYTIYPVTMVTHKNVAHISSEVV